jgi:hypothetical protein
MTTRRRDAAAGSISPWDNGKRCVANWSRLVAALALLSESAQDNLMGHPTLSSEQIRQRDDEILAYANQHPKATNGEIGVKYGMSSQAIGEILYRGRRIARRHQRLVAKARKWGPIGTPA